jgi:hypothetical protein
VNGHDWAAGKKKYSSMEMIKFVHYASNDGTVYPKLGLNAYVQLRQRHAFFSNAAHNKPPQVHPVNRIKQP